MSLSPELQAAADGERPGRASRGWVFVLVMLAAAGALAWVAVTSFDQRVYYYTVSEAAPLVDDLHGQQLRLKGNVLPGSHLVNETELDDHRFVLFDGTDELQVAYRGPLPDTFQDEAEVVALGRINEEGVFVAEEITAKCPSRYEGEAPTAQR